MYELGDGVAQNDLKAAEIYANKHIFNLAPNDPRNSYPGKYTGGIIEYGFMTEEAMESLLNLWSQGRGWPDEKDKTIPGYRKPEEVMESNIGTIKSAKAQFCAGEIYYLGKLVPKSLAKAAQWYSKAAVSGSADAMNRIGEMWAMGADGTVDLMEAAKWYRKAAFKGSVTGAFNLGRALTQGAGVDQNKVEALAWLRVATDGGSPDARTEIGGFTEKLSPEQIDSAARRVIQIKASLPQKKGAEKKGL
jgi:TPR repeat protein